MACRRRPHIAWYGNIRLSISERRIQQFSSRIAVLCAAALILLGIAPVSAADWRQEVGTFRVGMVASGAPTAAGLEALRQSYSAALGMPVDFFIARDFAMLIDAQATSRVEYAIYSAMAYATVAELCECVEPIAAPVDVDGASGIRSILIARKGRLALVADLPKTSLIVAPDDDFSGRLAPLSLLSEAGLTLRGDESFIETAQTAVAAEAEFAAGRAEALLGWERVMPNGEALLQGGTMDRLRRAGVDVAGLDRVWSSPILVYGPHAVLKSLDPEAKQLLSGFLTGLHAGNPQAYDLVSGGHAGGFMSVDEAVYAPVRQVVQTAAGSEP